MERAHDSLYQAPSQAFCDGGWWREEANSMSWELSHLWQTDQLKNPRELQPAGDKPTCSAHRIILNVMEFGFQPVGQQALRNQKKNAQGAR